MATANENTTAPEASVVEDDRSIRGEDQQTLAREDRSVNREDLAEDQSISGDDRSMRVHNRHMLEVGHQLVHARDRPMFGDRSMVGDRSVFRREGLPVVLGNTFLDIEN